MYYRFWYDGLKTLLMTSCGTIFVSTEVDLIIHLVQVMELGINFLAADDMSGILEIQLRKRLGFGMWAKLHVTGMHVEGKVNNY